MSPGQLPIAGAGISICVVFLSLTIRSDKAVGILAVIPDGTSGVPPVQLGAEESLRGHQPRVNTRTV